VAAGEAVLVAWVPGDFSPERGEVLLRELEDELDSLEGFFRPLVLTEEFLLAAGAVVGLLIPGAVAVENIPIMNVDTHIQKLPFRTNFNIRASKTLKNM